MRDVARCPLIAIDGGTKDGDPGSEEAYCSFAVDGAEVSGHRRAEPRST